MTTKELELRQLVSACYACDTQVGFAEQERRLNGLRDAAIEVIHWQLPLVGHRREELPPRSLRPSEGFGVAGIHLIEKLNALYPHIDAVEPLAAWCGSQKTVVAEVDGKTARNLPTAAHKDNHENMVNLLFDESTKEILAIQRSNDLNSDEKMRQICGLDRRYVEWDSEQWGLLLGVKGAAIRKTSFWKQDRKKAQQAMRDMRDD